jgi:general secretion pathway protein N
MQPRSLVILAAALFALTVLVRAPAAWVLAAAPAAIECRAPAGSVWHGACGQLRVPGAELDGIGWSLHFWPLLLGRLELELRSADARAPGTVRLTRAPGGRLELSDLHADLPLDAGLVPLFPAGWSGQLQLALTSIVFSDGKLALVQGTVTARSLAQRSPAMPFGSYQLDFFPVTGRASARAGLISAQLHDLGGPLAVTGTLTIRGSEYELSGLVSARAEASAELAKAVGFLGPADVQGRRTFTLGGTF